MTNLTVIIPTLSNFSGLKYQLNYFKGENYDVVVVDNGPNKDKEELVHKVYKVESRKADFIYLPQRENLGYE